MTPRPAQSPAHRVPAACPIHGAAAPIVRWVLCSARVPSGGLDRAPALPASADFDVYVMKSGRVQAIRQSLWRDRVAGVAEVQDPEPQRRHAVAAGEDAAWAQHSESLGEQPVL